jgi:hypothetical protein
MHHEIAVPAWNQIGCPSCPICCRQKNVSPFTPQPRSRLSIPESTYVMESMSGKRTGPAEQVVAGVDDDCEFFRWDKLAAGHRQLAPPCPVNTVITRPPAVATSLGCSMNTIGHQPRSGRDQGRNSDTRKALLQFEAATLRLLAKLFEMRPGSFRMKSGVRARHRPSR